MFSTSVFVLKMKRAALTLKHFSISVNDFMILLKPMKELITKLTKQFL